MRSFLYRLFFTRDDDLDLLQVFLLSWIVLMGFAVIMVGRGKWTLPAEAWDMLKWVFASLFIAGVPTWLAKLYIDWKRGP